MHRLAVGEPQQIIQLVAGFVKVSLYNLGYLKILESIHVKAGDEVVARTRLAVFRHATDEQDHGVVLWNRNTGVARDQLWQ
jgi:hypothetical protein